MRAVFLDRDGVINVNRVDHVKCWEEFEFIPGAIEAIVRLSNAGWSVFVVTNQAVVNRGMVSRDLVEWINARMQRAIEQHGGNIAGVAYCPHRSEEQCPCRKPAPGLLIELAATHRVDLTSSVLIGDALTDIEAGRSVGCLPILVLTGRGRDQFNLAQSAGRNGFEVADSLGDAANLVLRRMPASV